MSNPANAGVFSRICYSSGALKSSAFCISPSHSHIPERRYVGFTDKYLRNQAETVARANDKKQ